MAQRVAKLHCQDTGSHKSHKTWPCQYLQFCVTWGSTFHPLLIRYHKLFKDKFVLPAERAGDAAQYRRDIISEMTFRCFERCKSIHKQKGLSGIPVSQAFVTKCALRSNGLRAGKARVSRGHGRRVTRATASPAGYSPDVGGPQPGEVGSDDIKKTCLAGPAAGGALAAATLAVLYKTGALRSIYASLSRSILGRSGFLGAFSLIFASELGDKTFFIAALLAAKVGKWRSLIGSSAALGIMTVISVCIGSVFSRLPDAMTSSIPIGQYLGAALMLLFGLRTLYDSYKNSSADDEGELCDAEDSLACAERDGKICVDQRGGLWKVLLQVGTLIFVAEWGDRSMLATIALAAAHPPVAVAVGATLAHIAATAIAVIGGSIASEYISEKVIGYTGGVLFLLFSALTFFGVF